MQCCADAIGCMLSIIRPTIILTIGYETIEAARGDSASEMFVEHFKFNTFDVKIS